MKVVTYTAQTQKTPGAGGGFLTAQLSTQAMTATARTAKAGFEQLSSTAEQVAELAFKKALVNNEGAAIGAATAYQQRLNDASARALREAPLDAERMFAAETEVARKAAGANLKRGARREFDRRSPAVTAAARSAFQTQNGPRYEALAQSNVDKGVDAGINAGSDVSKSDTDRLEAMAASRQSIEDGNPLLGPLSSAKSEVRLLTGLASGTLLGLLRTSADPDALVSDFIDGKSTDVILAGILPQLTQEQQQTIGQKAQDAARKQIEVGIARRKSLSVAAAAENTASYQRMIGLDFTDPDLLSVARTEHERLKRIGYYESPAAIAAVDNLLFPEAADADGFSATDESRAEEARLAALESIDQLSYRELLASSPDVSPTFFLNMLQQLEGDRGDAEKAGIATLKRGFQYSENMDESGLLTGPSRAAFSVSAEELSEWVRTNPRATTKQIVAEAKKIGREQQGPFLEIVDSIKRQDVYNSVSVFSWGKDLKILETETPMETIIAELRTKLVGQDLTPENRRVITMAIGIAKQQFSVQVFAQ